MALTKPHLRLLTAAAKTKLGPIVEKWERLSMSTDPIDVSRCVEILGRLYRQQTLDVPKIELCASPLEALLLFVMLSPHLQPYFTPKLPGPEVYAALNTHAKRWLTHSLAGTMVRQRALYWSVRSQMAWDLAGSCNIEDIARRHMGCLVPHKLEDPFRRAIQCLAMFHTDSLTFGNMASEDYCLNVLKVPQYQVLEHHIELAQQVGVWIADRSCVVLVDRPAELHFDDQGRLHHESKAAILYRDGYGVYAHHGNLVPKFVITNPEQITAEAIQTEANAEIARIMLLKFGEERYLEHFKPVGQPWRGAQLYQTSLGGSRLLSRVRCINSTPEPDGTSKVYWLKVPPEVSCAQEALASIHINPFRQDWKQYQPTVET